MIEAQEKMDDALSHYTTSLCLSFTRIITVVTDTCDKMIQNWLIMRSKIYTHLIKLIIIVISIVKPANTNYF
jgi:hypothetical protein